MPPKVELSEEMYRPARKKILVRDTRSAIIESHNRAPRVATLPNTKMNRKQNPELQNIIYITLVFISSRV